MFKKEQALWYVVHTYTGYEQRVAMDMRRIIEKDKDRPNDIPIELVYVYDVMVPTRVVKELRNGKVRSREKRLFPGYVFVKMVKNIETWYTVRHVYGVTGFVGPCGEPTPLSGREVEWIRRIQIPVKIDIKIGDRVIFKSDTEYDVLGFPSGVEMTIEDVDENEHIRKLSFTLANKKNIIECDYDFVQVEKVSELIRSQQAWRNLQAIKNQQILKRLRSGKKEQTDENPQAAKNPQTGGNPQAAGNPQTEGTPQAAGNPQTEGTPQAAGNPQTEGTPQAAGNPQTEGTPQTAGNPQTEGTPQAAGNPQTGETPQAAENPQTEGTPQAAGNPQTEGTPQAEAPAQAGESPQAEEKSAV